MAVTITVDEAAPDLTRLRFLFVNIYLWGTPASWMLIDGGLRGCAGTIRKVAADRFGRMCPRRRSSSRTVISTTSGRFPICSSTGTFRSMRTGWSCRI